MVRKIKNKGAVISDNSLDDFIWMSYRYCIGRHTIAAAYHAETIRRVIMSNPNSLSPEKKAFMATDIRREINTHVCWRNNVYVDGPRDKDLYSMILYKGSETPNEKMSYKINEYDNTIITKPCEDEKYVPYDEYFEDYIRWIRLANILDIKTHKNIKVSFNGEESEHICYPYPMKQNDGSYKEVWCSLDKDLINNSYLAEEYIVEIK